MNRSKINAGGINQQPMYAVTAAIANSIKINVQSIFKQYTKRQNRMNAKLKSVHWASICKAFSVYKQSAQCQRPMHTASTTNMHSISIQCTQCQQPMCFASTANAHSIRLPYAWFLQSEYFHSSQYVFHSCHSARSQRRSRRIHTPRKYALLGCVGWSSSKSHLPLREK